MLGDLSLSEVLGKYRVFAELGGGGMARVFLAVSHGHAGFNKLVVLKVIRPELAEDPDIVKMFVHEAQLAGQLNHPNVVQTLEVDELDGRLVMVMEYLEGQSFNTILKRARRDHASLPDGLHLRVLHEALSGLHYAHELTDYQGRSLHIVHRDISPQNIFVTYDGQTKLLDFGIAKAITSSTETKTGVIKGKLPYMAAEQFLGEALDRRADVYAFGALLWHAAAGRPLWKGVSQAQIMYRVARGEIPLPEEVNAKVHPELQRICMRALALDPEERYPTALDLQADLGDYMKRAGLEGSSVETGQFVRTLFADTRERIRSVVKQKMEELEATGFAPTGKLPKLAATSTLTAFESQGDTPHSSPSGILLLGQDSQPSGSIPLEISTSDPGAPGPVPSDSQAQVRPLAASMPPTQASPDQGTGHRKALIAGVVFLLAAAAGALLVLWPSPHSSSPSLHATNEASSASPAASSEPPVTPTAQAAPKTSAVASITLSASPSNATLFLDNEKLPSNPSVRKMPRDNQTHRLRAEAPNHVTQAVQFMTSQQQTVSVKLSRSSAGARPAATHPRVARPKPDPTPPAAATTTAAPAPKPKPPKHASPKPVPTTDNINPWAN